MEDVAIAHDPELSPLTLIRPRYPLGAAIRRRWWVPLVVGLVVGSAAYAVARQLPKHYQAQGQIFIDPQGSRLIPAGQNQTSEAVGTLSRLITSDIVLRPVAQKLNTPLGDLRKRVDAAPETGSSVITLTATARTPAAAVSLADDVEESYGRQAKARAGVKPRDLSATGIAYYSNPSLPVSPSAPQPVFDAIIAASLGAVLAAILVWLRVAFVAPVASAGRLSEALLEGAVVDLTSAQRRRKRNRMAAMESAATDMLLHRPNARRIVVVGVEPIAAPAALATDLAYALSGSGRGVTLFDFDIRGRRLSRYIKVNRDAPGVDHWLEDSSTTIPLVTASGENALSLVPGAQETSLRPGVLIRALVDDLAQAPDELQVIFGAGLSQRAETMRFVGASDITVLVVGLGTRLEDLQTAVERLNLVQRPPLLVVLDRAHQGRSILKPGPAACEVDRSMSASVVEPPRPPGPGEVRGSGQPHGKKW